MQLSTAKFAGHQSFPFRNTWLTKGVLECARDPAFFRRDDAMVVLGVGKNMVDSIKYWCLATQVLEIDPEVKNNRGYFLRPTPLGSRIFLEDGGWDPYLEDEGTLWLVHCLLATNPEWATTVYFAFNEMPGLQFSRSTLKKGINSIAAQVPSVRATENTIKRDLSVFVRTYVGSRNATGLAPEDSLDCPLAELGLIHEEPMEGVLAFPRGPKDGLPDAVVLYSIWTYAQVQAAQRTFTFEELAYRPFSPGRIFKLDEPALAERLERVATITSGACQMTETLGYRQVVVRDTIEPLEILQDYYRDSTGNES
jgi:hypothetical protein